MTRRTNTRAYREYEITSKSLTGALFSKRAEPLPAVERKQIEFEWQGVNFKVWVSPGQTINKARIYKKWKRDRFKKK
jgi:hypothetical protein